MALSLLEARELHREVAVIDLHADTPMLSHVTGYDINQRHSRKVPKAANYAGHLDSPRMRDGGLAAQIFGMWTLPYPEFLCPRSIHKQIDAIEKNIANSKGEMRQCWTGQDVREAQADGCIAVLSGIEGGQALRGNAASVAQFAARGVRYIGLLHFSANALGTPAYGRGARADAGLSARPRSDCRDEPTGRDRRLGAHQQKRLLRGIARDLRTGHRLSCRSERSASPLAKHR